MKSYLKKVIFAGILLLLLAFLYFFAGNNSTEKTEDYRAADDYGETAVSENEDLHISLLEEKIPIHKENEKENPPEEEKIEAEKGELYCTITIRCDTILNNMNFLDEAKLPLVPPDGIILTEKMVTFREGESVFDVLMRETRNNGIHMEFVKSPIYDSAYIEGIHNLYEFDCGELSGWMYSVNGWFPNYGCSKYILNNDDRIEWVYTCDLGNDLK